MKTTTTAGLAAVVLVLTACGSDPDTDPAQTPTTTAEDTATTTTPEEEAAQTTTQPPQDDVTTTTAPPTPDDAATTTAPPTLSEAEQDQQDATQAVIDYRAVADRVYAGEAPAREFTPITSSPLRTEAIRLANSYGMAEKEQVGESAFEPDRAEPGDEEDTWVVYGCLDVTEVDVFDAAGESTVDRQTRVDRLEFRYTVLQRDGDWYVSQETPQDSTC